MPVMELGKELQLEFCNSTRGHSRLVGLKKKEYLIIEYPIHHDPELRPKILNDGSPIILRYIDDGIVYGVKSSIAKTIYSPFSIILIRYPKVIENHKLRKTKRSSCALHTYLDVDNRLIEGLITNASTGGCRICVDTDKGERLKEKGKELSLSVQIPGSEGVVTLNGAIRNFTREGSKISLGIEFLESEAESKSLAKISEYITTLEQMITVDDDFTEENMIEV